METEESVSEEEGTHIFGEDWHDADYKVEGEHPGHTPYIPRVVELLPEILSQYSFAATTRNHNNTNN